MTKIPRDPNHKLNHHRKAGPHGPPKPPPPPVREAVKEQIRSNGSPLR